MAFLASFAAAIFEWFMTKVFALLQKNYEEYKANQAAAKAAQQAKDNLDKAQTGDEIDKATDDSLNNL